MKIKLIRNYLLYDDECIEMLEDMSKKGWKLKGIIQPFFIFEKCDHELKYAIDYNALSEEFSEMYEAMGYHHICCFNHMHFYYNDNLDADELDSDEDLMYEMKAKNYSKLGGFISLLLAFLIFCFVGLVRIIFKELPLIYLWFIFPVGVYFYFMMLILLFFLIAYGIWYLRINSLCRKHALNRKNMKVIDIIQKVLGILTELSLLFFIEEGIGTYRDVKYVILSVLFIIVIIYIYQYIVFIKIPENKNKNKRRIMTAIAVIVFSTVYFGFNKFNDSVNNDKSVNSNDTFSFGLIEKIEKSFPIENNKCQNTLLMKKIEMYCYDEEDDDIEENGLYMECISKSFTKKVFKTLIVNTKNNSGSGNTDETFEDALSYYNKVEDHAYELDGKIIYYDGHLLIDLNDDYSNKAVLDELLDYYHTNAKY